MASTRGRRSTRALPDLVILDIGLPRLDGLELCRRLRGRSEALPIIFVTSREEEFDRVLGLEIGADDYLCKPFSMRELIARIKVLLRRAALAANAAGARGRGCGGAGAGAATRLKSGCWKPAACGSICSATRPRGRAAPLALTVTEFLLLQALVRHPGHVKTRDQLMQHAYPDNTFVSDRTIDSHVKRVRRKLEEIDPGFASIETVYGLGYRFTPDAPDSAATAEAPDAAGARPPKRDTPDGQHAVKWRLRPLWQFVRRASSRIAVRMLAFNVLLVFLPLAGLLYLDTYEQHLLEAQERSMVQQGRILAAALVRSRSRSTPKRSIASCARSASASKPACASSTPPAASSATPAAPAIRPSDPHSTTAAQSRRLPRRPAHTSIVRAAPHQMPAIATAAASASREAILYRVGSSVLLTRAAVARDVAGLVVRRRARAGTVLPPLDPGQIAQPASWPEVQAALAGRYGSATRLTRGGQRSVTLYSALPIRSGGSRRFAAAKSPASSSSRNPPTGCCRRSTTCGCASSKS